MHDALRAIAALGVFVAVPLWGIAILRRARHASDETALALAVPVGVAAWSLVLGVAAYAGIFRPAILGALGWLTAVALAVSLRLARPRGFVALAVAGVAVLFFAYGAFPNEAILGDRDQGLYTLIGMLLGRTGGVVVSTPPEAQLSPALSAPFVNGQPFYLPGIYSTSTGLRLQFGALFPAWIAQFTAATAGWGVFRINALLCALTVPVFYVLLRRVCGVAVAIAGTVAFALEPAQVWIARINLVEPFAQLLVLGGLLAAYRAIEARNRALASVAALQFGVATFARLDMVLVVPLLFAAWLFVRVWRADAADDNRALAHVAWNTALASATACGLAVLTNPIYVADNRFALIAAALATLLVLAAIALTGPRGAAALRAPATRAGARIVVIAGIAALLVYAAAIRPYVEPFALVERVGSNLQGTRDYRELSVRSLAAYLTWPVVALAAAGAATALGAGFRGRARTTLVLLSVVAAGASIAMLANPRIAPDHFWAVRRYVPLVIPLMLIMAGIAVGFAVARMPTRAARGSVAAATVLLAAVLVYGQRHTLLVAENAGLLERVQRVALAVPPAAHVILAREADAIGTTLLLAYGMPIVPLRDAGAEVNAENRRVWLSCSSSAPCALLHRDYAGLAGLALSGSRVTDLTRQYVKPTLVPLPGEIATAHERLIVSFVHGIDDAAHGNARIGGYRDWRVDDAGFNADETDASGSARWTRGTAVLSLPRVSGADTLEIDAVVPRPGTPVRVELDGRSVFSRTLDTGPQRIRVPLDVEGARMLRIVSPAVTGRDLGVIDDRTLGLRVSAVRQIDSHAGRLDAAAPSAAYAGAVQIMGSPRVSGAQLSAAEPYVIVPLTVENGSSSIWPSPPDLLSGEQPVSVGIQWRKHGSDQVVRAGRMGLPGALYPGERLRMNATLEYRTAEGVLDPGDYVVEFDLVQENVAWFATRGGASAKLAVTVAR